MTNRQANTKVKHLFLRFEKARLINDNFSDEEIIKADLKKCINIVGIFGILNRTNLFKIVEMQSALRAIPEHTFYINFLNK